MASLTIIDSLLMARALIARLGERDLLGWWDDHALSQPGRFVLERLFPRTTSLAQIEVAAEAAATRHRALVPQPSRLTLFRLPGQIEAEARRRLLALKRDSAAERAALEEVARSQPTPDVAGALLARGLVGAADLDAARAARPSGHVLKLGRVDSADLTGRAALERALRRLLAGYVVSTRGNLIVPVLEPA